MTRFKKCGDVRDVLMVQSNRIVRKPNGEVIVDPHGIHKKNEVWFAKARDENGDLRLDLFSDIVSSCASAFLVRYIFDLNFGKNLSRGAKRGSRSSHTIYHLITRLPKFIFKFG